MMERYVVLGEFPIEAYHDGPAREFYWGKLREEAGRGIARREGWTISEADGERNVMFARYVETRGKDETGEDTDEVLLMLWPCPEAEAEMAVMRLTCWAMSPEESSAKE